MFYLYKPCETYDPRAGPFLYQATFNKLGSGLLDDNTCTN